MRTSPAKKINLRWGAFKTNANLLINKLPMNLQIELFTTPTVEGRKILSSKGFVCANVVLGARVIEDEYKEKWTLPNYLDTDGVEPYHVELFEAIENEVLAKGANAVIDLHIEHSYVHRGDYYHLLISAQGTAVVLDGTIEYPLDRKVNSKVLEQQILRKHIMTKLNEWHKKYQEEIKEYNRKKSCQLSHEEWEFISRYPDLSFADYLHFAYNEVILYVPNASGSDNCIYETLYYKYFKKLPYEKQIELAYKYGGWRSSHLIVECELFDAKQILAWAQKGELEFATECLKARKKEYSSQDLEDMQELYDFFDNLPKKGKIGLTKEQEERVKEYCIKVETLKELLSSSK